jgi:hypothetical protein
MTMSIGMIATLTFSRTFFLVAIVVYCLVCMPGAVVRAIKR